MQFLVQKKKKSGSPFFDLPSSEQEKIVKKAVIKANEEQSELIERYDREFSKMSKGECKV